MILKTELDKTIEFLLPELSKCAEYFNVEGKMKHLFCNLPHLFVSINLRSLTY